MYFKFKNYNDVEFYYEERELKGELLDRFCDKYITLSLGNDPKNPKIKAYRTVLKDGELRLELVTCDNIKDIYDTAFLCKESIDDGNRLYIEGPYVKIDHEKRSLGRIYDGELIFEMFPEIVVDLMGELDVIIEASDSDEINELFKDNNDLAFKLCSYKENKKDPDILIQLAEQYGLKRDGKSWYKYYKEAIALGSEEARITIANAYLEGKYLAQNINKAICLVTEGALLQQVKSIEWLVSLYTEGRYVPVNYALANSYAKVGAALDSTECRITLINNYINGVGAKKNLDAAIFYARQLSRYNGCDGYCYVFNKRADDAIAMSNYVLGNIYLKCKELNKEKAGIGCLERASSLGSREASLLLSEIYKDDIEKSNHYKEIAKKQFPKYYFSLNF